MRREEIKIGSEYRCRLERGVVRVRVDSTADPNGGRGWIVTDVETGRQEHVLRHEQFRERWAIAPAGTVEYADRDPDACAAAGCDRPAALTYLNRPLCQACYENEVAEGDETSETPNHEENDMAKAKKTTKKSTTKNTSALDAAAEVLKKAGKPMRSQEMIVAMAEQGLWESPAGKTPHATLYAAILREIGARGSEARFRKVERGQFAFAG